MSPTIFHLDLDAFFASVEEVLRPSLRGKAVIVGGSPTGRGIVACPNYEARRLGVKTAMPASRAVKLAPNAVFVHGDYDQYKSYSQRFFKILGDYSPLVQPAGLDEGYLDARGCLHFWDGSAEVMGRAIKERVRRELGLAVSVGAAVNTMCAKVASDARKPDGLCVVPVGAEREFLAPLPVSAIPGVGEATDEALRKIGIRTVQELAQSDESRLRRALGSAGTYLFRAARGEAGRTILEERAPRAAKSVSRDQTFGTDVGDLASVRGALFTLCEHAAVALREDRQSARTVTLKLRYPNMFTFQRGQTLAEGTDSEFAIFRAADALLDAAWRPNMRVRLVGVSVSNLRETHTQLDLFNVRRTKELLLCHSLDRIRNKFGEDAVWFGIAENNLAR